MDGTANNTDALLRTRDAAVYIGVTASWLRQLAMRGLGPAIAEKRGVGSTGGNYYTREALDEWNTARRLKRVADARTASSKRGQPKVVRESQTA